jgi:very-short-patch-repair endonuclease
MRRAQPWKTNRSRVLRANETSAEALLWSAVRGRRFMDLKFVRQVSIGAYFADFVCRERMIIVEIDGATHSTPDEILADAKRTTALEAMGYCIFRVSNTDVFDNLGGVLVSLLVFIENNGSCEHQTRGRPSP